LREYDEKKGLLLELNNFIYNFLFRISIAQDNFGEKIWTRLLLRPLQEKESVPSNFVFDVLKEIYTKNDLAHLYAYIELLYDSLSELSEKVSSILSMAFIFGNLNIEFETGINNILTRFNTGLLLCSGSIVNGLDGSTMEQIKNVLEVYDTASKNFKTALRAISIDGPEDADLCIREAVCAVEYTIKKRLNVNTLLEGTRKLRSAELNESGQVIHGALLKSLDRLYDYTSDAARHSSVKPLTVEEARLVLSLSVAWVNYLRKALPEPAALEGNS
jgi:hypothetical protein